MSYRLTVRRDSKAILEVLEAAGLGPDTRLGEELHALVLQRAGDCRDLFALRGVRTRRPTALVMASRTLAADPTEARRLDAMTGGRGGDLLLAVAQLVERTLAPQLRRPAPPAPRRPAVVAQNPGVVAERAVARDLKIVVSPTEGRSARPPIEIPERLAA
jgi:hypothetical protein